MNNCFKIYEDKVLKEKYYYTKHKSGLDIYVFPKRMTQKTAWLGVKLGSFYEDGAIVDGKTVSYPDGIAHFLEHKLFSSEDGVDACEILASLGADANAYTSNNKTVYMFSCTENFEEALAELVSFVYDPHFTAENVASERGIITQEIKMCLDSPYDTVSRNLLTALYGKCKLSSDVLGDERSIAKISEKTLYSCYESFYRCSNMALVVCGDVDRDRVLRTVEDILKDHEAAEPPTLPTLSYSRAVKKPYIEKRMSVSQPIFEIGIKDAMPADDPRERLLRDVAMTILDEMLFSRAGELFGELFEGGYINESYSYGYSITRDAAFHSIYGEGDDPALVLERVKEYVERIKKRGLSERDFLRCKRVMYAEFIRDFDNVDDIAGSLMNIVFDGGELFEYRSIIESVSFDDVQKCFYESFDKECYALSVIKNK